MNENTVFGDTLVHAVMLNDFETVKKIIDSGNYDSTLFDDIGWRGTALPLHYLTKCYLICLDGEFDGNFGTIASRHRENAKKILALFMDILNLRTEPEIDFSKYAEVSLAEEDDPDEDIFGCDRSFLLEKGAREIDLNLYIAVMKMDFKKAETLLKDGASPEYKLPEGSALSVCGNRCSYYCTCNVGDVLKYPNTYNPTKGEEIGWLLIWAANEKMYNILSGKSGR